MPNLDPHQEKSSQFIRVYRCSRADVEPHFFNRHMLLPILIYMKQPHRDPSDGSRQL
jgi:hypothetical protein